MFIPVLVRTWKKYVIHYTGKSGIILDPARKAFGYRSGLTGYVDRPDLKGVLDRRARMMMPEQAEFAYMSTREGIGESENRPRLHREDRSRVVVW